MRGSLQVVHHLRQLRHRRGPRALPLVRRRVPQQGQLPAVPERGAHLCCRGMPRLYPTYQVWRVPGHQGLRVVLRLLAVLCHAVGRRRRVLRCHCHPLPLAGMVGGRTQQLPCVRRCRGQRWPGCRSRAALGFGLHPRRGLLQRPRHLRHRYEGVHLHVRILWAQLRVPVPRRGIESVLRPWHLHLCRCLRVQRRLERAGLRHRGVPRRARHLHALHCRCPVSLAVLLHRRLRQGPARQRRLVQRLPHQRRCLRMPGWLGRRPLRRALPRHQRSRRRWNCLQWQRHM
mmetsp:Transcript_1108/g.4488  ORF Transcript_1108/g.4488 Transcript_1108/m.4488 type:complete len:287 (-) Transcript_1108:4213-5073(-)